MNYFKVFIALIISVNLGCAQPPADRPHLQNPKFDTHVSRLISFSIPVISVEELNQNKSDYVIFDAREKEEYLVSHIEGAKYLGYKDFDASRLEGIPKESKIVLYCSVGYRSEKIGEELKELGFTNVYNLYGSIFEWVNQGYKVVETNGLETKKVHTYNKSWSKWLDETKAEKVW
jgi:rhodanese-related sulfurtransferase